MTEYHINLSATVQLVQKDSLHRQLLEYRREKITLKGRVKELMESSEYHQDHIRLIDAWFKQVSVYQLQSRACLVLTLSCSSLMKSEF